MAPPSYHMDKDSVVLSLCAGSSIVKAQTIFSSDSKLLFCCSGLVIKVFNTNNGQCALQLRGHKNVVTGLALHPGNKLQLFSCGLDGLVNQWDFSDGVLLKSHDFHLPLHGLVCIDHIHGSIAVIAQRPHAANCSVLRLKLQKTGVKKKINSEERKIEPESLDEEDEHAETKQDILISVCSSDHRTVAYGCNGEYIAAVSGHELLVYSWKKRNLKKHTIDKANPFTCVACHPTETCLATGHTNGKIMFWWNFFTKDRKVTSTSHWHSLPVETLTFTPEGSYLLSGGHECVLVKWQVNTEQRDYLPRLGAPLCNISVSPDGTLYASCHTDNVIQLITSNFHIDFAIRGLARAHLGAEKPAKIIPAGLLLDPRSKALVTNGRPGHLQFFSLETDTQLYNLDIVGQNYISPESIKQPVTVTEVEQAAFDTQGEWLATFEHWDDGLMTPEYRLKFWCYNKKLQNYQLNTTVEQPHNKAITCMRFQPPVSNQAAQPPVLVTTSSDSTFKLWILVTETQANKTIDRWTCESVGFYRNQPATTARFSEDGSVLAVAFLGTLTLWDPETNVMSAILSDSSHKEPIRFVEFGGRNCSHLIVTATTSHLTVWNLISLSVHWRVPIAATVLVSNGDLMAVVSSDNDLFVFRPNKWSTLYSHPHLAEETILHAIFIPQSSADKVTMDLDSGALGWQQESRLYLFDSKQQLFTFDYVHNVASREKETSQSRVHLQQVLPETPFGALLGTTRSSQELNTPAYRPVGTVWHHKSSFVTEMLNTPAHSMPALHSICSQFIQSLLQKNASLKQDESEVKDSDDEVESAVETDDS